MSISKEVWLESDNIFVLQLMEESPTGVQEAVPLSSVDKIELYITDSSKNRIAMMVHVSDDPKAIDWVGQAGVGYITFKLGPLFQSYNVKPITYACELQVYDDGNPNGVVWFSGSAKDFILRVRPKLEIV